MNDGGVTVSIRDRLLKERNALLDLSTRNRLLNTPLRTRNNRAIEIVDEKADEVFRLLTSNKAFSFLPGRPAERCGARRARSGRRRDRRHPPAGRRRRRRTRRRRAPHRYAAADAADLRRTAEAAVRHLVRRADARAGTGRQYPLPGHRPAALVRQRQHPTSPRHAPLVLLPVKLERTSAADDFKLTLARRTAVAESHTSSQDEGRVRPRHRGLQGRGRGRPRGLLRSGRRDRRRSQKRWEVCPDAMVLGFFSFSKFLMYRDLDPDNWPRGRRSTRREMIAALLRDGFPESAPLVADDARDR